MPAAGTFAVGIEAARQITKAVPKARVLALSMQKDSVYVREMLRAGARGYILKGADQAEMLRAIRAVASGEALFGPAIAQRLMSFFSRPPSAAP